MKKILKSCVVAASISSACAAEADDLLEGGVVLTWEGVHSKALTNTGAATTYPTRFEVPEDKVSWKVGFPGYQPVFFEHEKLAANNMVGNKGHAWAHPYEVSEIPENCAIRSYGPITFYDVRGQQVPRNPVGRTGIIGRGLLGHWGGNFAADPIVTRYNLEDNYLEALLCERQDSPGIWAIPGGMVEYGHSVSKKLKEELGEETAVQLNFNTARKVYKGYVDDPRNTDNAWMETVAAHRHIAQGEQSGLANPSCTKDEETKSVAWVRVTKGLIETGLYASHGRILRGAFDGMPSSLEEVDNEETVIKILSEKVTH